jgi:hypothetical protein
VGFESHPGSEEQVASIESVLDQFHAAASTADEKRYFACLAPDAVFIGTDSGERWVGDEFRAFVHRYFPEGRGWTYVPSARFVSLSEDQRTAWFDERLDNATYGECRGTGVLELRDGDWKIEQYCLTMPIPNEIAKEVAARIREVRAPGTD